MHCGRCSTCVERVGAFLEAGVEDPTDYADRDFALRELAAAKGAVTTMATLPLESTVEG
jgi:7-cyano-7-deazaguanine synthase